MADYDEPVVAWTSVTRPPLDDEDDDDPRRFEGFWGEWEEGAREYTKYRPHLRLVKLIEEPVDYAELTEKLETAKRHISVLIRFWMENPGWTEAANAARDFLNE